MLFVEFKGRLGNWLFQYAAAMSQGATKVLGFVPDPRTMLALEKYKGLFKDIEFVNSLPMGIDSYCEPKYSYCPFRVDGDLQDILISGYFQSERYVDSEKVRRLLRVAPERETRLRQKFGKFLDAKNVTGIHIRRGDYLKIPERHPFVGEKYIAECIDRISECNDFIVCSDDIPWCKRFLSKRFPLKRFCYSDNEDPLDDLYLLSLCKNDIMSNSSFSWWGAWLNENPNKRVLAPSTWFGFAYKLEGLDWKDVYFNGTEVVENSCGIRSLCRGILSYLQKMMYHFICVCYMTAKRLLLHR